MLLDLALLLSYKTGRKVKEDQLVDYQKLANDDIATSLSHHNVLPEYKDISVAERKAVCDSDRLPYAVAILNVTGELNTGTIIRNALLMGAREVLVIGRRKIDKRGTVGAENYINVDRIEAMIDEVTIDCDKVRKIFTDRNYWPVYVEQGGTEIPNFDWHKLHDHATASGMTPILVFGNENRGVPDVLLDSLFGDIVSVRQRGVLRSYNVGVTSGMVMMDMLTNMGWW